MPTPGGAEIVADWLLKSGRYTQNPQKVGQTLSVGSQAKAGVRERLQVDEESLWRFAKVNDTCQGVKPEVSWGRNVTAEAVTFPSHPCSNHIPL
jgi:hypothetical protein